ncbi:MAG: peptidase domain-containing ABC transporter [Alphaproteobacteria bacterium]|jgi:ATP-binding cassette subfamily B protein/ATP-binding cassette subfamily C protein LapB|nr:peptidase domain-containing ABC transporter [Alphaproteobacteria bacterium]
MTKDDLKNQEDKDSLDSKNNPEVSEKQEEVSNIETPPVEVVDKLSSNQESSQGDKTLEEINVDLTEQEEDHRKYLKVAFERVLKNFDKNTSEEILYSGMPVQDGIISTTDIIAIARKIGLNVEMRRINILDIKTGPCILMLKNNASYAFLEGNKGFNPETGQEEEYKPAEIIKDYIGYALFFFEEDLTVSTFVKKTSFLFNSLSNFKPIFIEILVISFFINIFAIVSPFYTMNIYDRIVPNHAISTLFVLSFGMVLVYLFDFAFKLIKSYLTDYISLNIGNEVDQVLLDKLLAMKIPIAMSNGAKTSLFKELSMVREFYFSRFIPMLIDLPFLSLFFLLLIFISPWIALVPFIACIFIFVINILLQVPMQNTYHKMMMDDANRTGMLVEVVSGSESIKIFNGIGKVLYKWKRVLDKSYRTNFSYNLWVNIAANSSMTIMNIVTVVVVIVGVFEISGNAMTTGGLIASTTVSSRIMSTIIGFSGMVVRYRSIQNTLKHLEKIINAPMEDDTENNGKKGPFKGNITFKDVSFFYPGLTAPILNKCNLNIQAGSKVAIIGKTGAGKSTITRLLLGLDFHNNGEILIDDIDINYIHVSELRSNIGFMPQKSYFFQGTLRENILMSNTDIPEEQYQKACEIAGVSLVTKLSHKGDDMMIQEGGKNLSGGQQQIVALARAIINNPPIVIMDEPTNGMDTSLEAVFMENTKKYVKDKTFILITHKPSQLSLVDRVILVDNSTVVIDDTKEKVIEILNKGRKA